MTSASTHHANNRAAAAKVPRGTGTAVRRHRFRSSNQSAEQAMDLSKCRDACLDCHRTCLETAVHGLVKGEPHPRDHIRLLWDCADICITSANFMSRGSPFHKETCAACAVLCAACAEACGRMDDPIMQRCAETCRACAALCREMVAG
jgi:hypothetical protein